MALSIFDARGTCSFPHPFAVRAGRTNNPGRRTGWTVVVFRTLLGRGRVSGANLARQAVDARLHRLRRVVRARSAPVRERGPRRAVRASRARVARYPIYRLRRFGPLWIVVYSKSAAGILLSCVSQWKGRWDSDAVTCGKEPKEAGQWVQPFLMQAAQNMCRKSSPLSSMLGRFRLC